MIFFLQYLPLLAIFTHGTLSSQSGEAVSRSKQKYIVNQTLYKEPNQSLVLTWARLKASSLKSLQSANIAPYQDGTRRLVTWTDNRHTYQWGCLHTELNCHSGEQNRASGEDDCYTSQADLAFDQLKDRLKLFYKPVDFFRVQAHDNTLSDSQQDTYVEDFDGKTQHIYINCAEEKYQEVRSVISKVGRAVVHLVGVIEKWLKQKYPDQKDLALTALTCCRIQGPEITAYFATSAGDIFRIEKTETNKKFEPVSLECPLKNRQHSKINDIEVVSDAERHLLYLTTTSLCETKKSDSEQRHKTLLAELSARQCALSPDKAFLLLNGTHNGLSVYSRYLENVFPLIGFDQVAAVVETISWVGTKEAGTIALGTKEGYFRYYLEAKENPEDEETLNGLLPSQIDTSPSSTTGAPEKYDQEFERFGNIFKLAKSLKVANISMSKHSPAATSTIVSFVEHDTECPLPSYAGTFAHFEAGHSHLTLIDAVKNGHYDDVREILDTLPKDERATFVKEKGSLGQTALHHAAIRGHHEVVRVLLDQLPKDVRATYVKEKDIYGKTALHSAAYNNHHEVVRVLLDQLPGGKRAAYVREKDKDGKTALHIAKSHEVVRILLNELPGGERAAYVSAKDNLGQTALHDAAEYGHHEVVRVLLDQLPKDVRATFVKEKDIYGQTALHSAAYNNHHEVVRVLLDQLPGGKRATYVREKDKASRTALHCAKSHEVVRVLLDQLPGGKRATYVSAKDNLGQTALHDAAEYGHHEVVRVLLDQLPKDVRATFVKEKDIYGQTALHYAAEYGSHEVVRVLFGEFPVGERADYVREKDKDGKTALHIAKSHEVVRILLNELPGGERAAYVSAKDKDGKTALHDAARNGHHEVVRVLLNELPKDERATYVKEKDKDGKTALHDAAKYGHHEVVRVLLDQLPTGERAAYVREKNKDGLTALHLAANNIHDKAGRVLLNELPEGERAAYLKEKDNDGRTALHSAVSNCLHAFVRVLLNELPKDERATYVKEKDKDGKTALHDAAKYGHHEVVRVLLNELPKDERATYVKEKDKDDKTALHDATENGHHEVVQMLLDELPEGERAAGVSRRSVCVDNPVHVDDARKKSKWAADAKGKGKRSVHVNDAKKKSKWAAADAMGMRKSAEDLTKLRRSTDVGAGYEAYEADAKNADTEEETKGKVGYVADF